MRRFGPSDRAGPMKIAIVGSGISGLVCAHLLRRRHEITLFEADSRLGGHTNTIRVDLPDETHHVDTGFIVYNDRNYPGFERLLDQLGVATQPSEMSFSVSDGDDFEYNGSSPNGLFACRSHLVKPSFHRMLFDLLRFNRQAQSLIGLNGDGPSLGEFIEAGGYSPDFVERLIVPQASAVWSADPSQMWTFPRVSWPSSSRTTACSRSGTGRTGAPSPAARSATWRRSRRRSPIASACPLRCARSPVPPPGSSWCRRGGEPERFDQVVIAAHSDQALDLLADPSRGRARGAGRDPLPANEAVLHTDVRQLPRRRRAWASWNFHLEAEPTGRTTVTYHMNRLQSLRSRSELCVTLNRREEIAPERVIETIHYSHPVFTEDGLAAQRRWSELNGLRGTWFCGSYWGYGFHEDGVASALRVCEQLGESL